MVRRDRTSSVPLVRAHNDKTAVPNERALFSCFTRKDC
jgi:hypothetical protein